MLSNGRIPRRIASAAAPLGLGPPRESQHNEQAPQLYDQQVLLTSRTCDACRLSELLDSPVSRGVLVVAAPRQRS
jgi:hypothetical protein